VRPKRVEAVSSNIGAILEVHIRGEIIRATTNHPFFVKKRGWTPAEELRPGDLLFTHSSGWIAVDEIKHVNAAVDVYNLRVADDRTYFVGSAIWGFAVWVHNDACIPEFDLNREFDVIIRDNTTASILFMGRISDPSQLQNEVSPSFAAPKADFDGNLIVDGHDFLAWQRGAGRLDGAAASDGDGDQDGDVDRTDLGYWRAAFGQVSAPASRLLTAAAPDPLPEAAASPEILSAMLRDAAFLNWAAHDSQLAKKPSLYDLEPVEAQLVGKSLKPRFEDFASAFGDPSFSTIRRPPATVPPCDAEPTAEPPTLEPVFATGELEPRL
jgi:hypothetical protein